jgi:hypothetical protein
MGSEWNINPFLDKMTKNPEVVKETGEDIFRM